MSKILMTFMVFLLTTSPFQALCADKKDKKAGFKYLRIVPDIVTNLSAKGRFHYGLFRIDLVTDTPDNLKLLRHHQPLYIDRLILYINAHSKDSFKNTLKRMEFQTGALELIQKVLKRETGKPIVLKILFSRMVTEGK